ncbi:MAG: VWA domain-containing protein [Treponema sp.]|nr:VWA domain-containing protein [Treponema sp.]
MKKSVFALILMAAIVSGVSGQQAGGSVDLVVVLDTSASMSEHYWETSDYLVGPFLREFLRFGDTFHLISFAETPRLEITRRVLGFGDVEIIAARLLMMYPLGTLANLGSALGFAESYTALIPANRSRMVILISDGASPGASGLIAASQGRLAAAGVDFRFIQVPVIGDGPLSGRPVTAPPTAVTPPPAPPIIAQPGVLPPGVTPPVIALPPGAVVPPDAALPPGVAPPDAALPPGVAPPDAALPPGVQPPDAALPPGVQPPDAALPPGVQPPGAELPPGAVAPPGIPPPAAQQATPMFAGGIPTWLIILLALLALGILAFIIFLLARNLHRSPNRVMAKAVQPPASQKADAAMMNRYEEAQRGQGTPPIPPPPPPVRKNALKDKLYTPPEDDNGPLMLNLFVEDQNTAIGKRNIHMAKSGTTFSVGGGNSDFLIFLVSVPPNIAEIRCEGRNCTFIPKKPRYFPDIGSQPVYDCIGKTVRVVSDKNYELFIQLERYEDPLVALNKLLNSISVPGEIF